MLRRIGRHPIGAGHPVFTIAEIGLNHGGSLDRALALVDAAAQSGAQAVKLQSLTAERLVAPSCPAPAHVQASSLSDFFVSFELSNDAHRALVARAREHGLAVMTTPLSLEIVPMLEALGVDAYKIASGDITFDRLIERTSATGRPLVVSTGMSSMAEVVQAVAAVRRGGGRLAGLLHCVSAYPVSAPSQNLAAIATLRRVFEVPIGLSDHASSGLASAVAAVALGASVYERHLVLDDDHDAVDRAVSSTPDELRRIIALMEDTRVALGDGVKRCQAEEAPNLVPSRRGLYARRALHAGDVVSEDDILTVRPATRLSPADVGRVAGSTLTSDIAAGEAFEPRHLNVRSAA